MNKRRRHEKNLAAKPALPSTAAAVLSTANHHYWPALTGLRGLAALMVLCLHAYVLAGKPASVPQPLAWLFAMGWSGVDIFFTLSAFLLTIPFVLADAGLGRKPVLLDYARHRLVRILPAYYVQMAILLACGAVGLGATWAWQTPKFSNVFAHLLLYHNAWPAIAAQVPLWWTLPVEMGFYCLLPLFARCLRPGRWPWLLLAIVASVAYRFWLMQLGLSRAHEVFWVEHLPGRLHQFLIGMLGAYAFVRLKMRTALPRAIAADALAVTATLLFLALPALGLLVSDQAFEGAPTRDPVLLCWHVFASLVIAALLIALAVGAPKLGRLLSSAPLRGLGMISYSLYLWHYPLMLGLRSELGGFAAIKGDFWPFFFYCILFSLLLAVASWWMIERPAQRWGRRATLSP